jgi:hypothetical protein
MNARRIITALLLALAACGEDDRTGPERVQGTFRLVAMNGQMLPLDLGPIQNSDGTFGPCHGIRVAGELVLDDHRWSLFFDDVNSCTQELLHSRHVNGGTFEQDGRELRFLIVLSPPPGVEFPGELRNGTLVLGSRADNTELTFQL